MSPKSTEPHRENNGHIIIVVFIMLTALTMLSFWISRSHLMDQRFTGWAAMTAVSVAKALLIAMVFMHLWWERAWKYVLTFPAMIMAGLLVLLLVPDIGYRNMHYSEDRETVAAEKIIAEEETIGSKELPERRR